MKNLIYPLVLLVTLGACNPLQKMVDSGKYDKAVITAARKMAGDKNKKTKHVKVLEQAFRKATADDLAAAKSYEDRGGLAYLQALEIYEEMEERQAIVAPFLPLVSKDGYEANIRFVRLDGLIRNAQDQVGTYYYETGKESLARSRATDDKPRARRAYDLLSKVTRYTPAPSDLASLRSEAYEIGLTHVFVNLRNDAPVYMPERFENAILGISVSDLNSTWKRYYLSPPKGQAIDVNATLVLDHISISPERERADHFEETQKIKDGWEYVLKPNGEIKTDTLGNKIKKDKFIHVRAKVTKVRRDKGIQIAGTIRYIDAVTGEPIRVQPITVENKFIDSACRVRGDRRALSQETVNCTTRSLDPFPTDHEMAMLAAYEMKGVLKGDLDYELY